METGQFNNRSHLINILLIIVNIAFFAYYIILALNSRPNFDDIGFMAMLQHQSIVEFVKEMYLYESGRFVAYFMNAIYTKLFLLVGFSNWLPLLKYAIGIGITWVAIKDCFNSIRRAELFLIMLFLYNLYVYTSIDFPVFTWPCGCGYLTQAPYMLLIVKYANLKRLNKIQFVIYGFLLFLIGGGSEICCGLLIALCSFNIMFYIYKNNWSIQNNPSIKQIRRLAFTILFITAMLSIIVIAPGNWVRFGREEFEVFERPTDLLSFTKAWFNVIIVFAYFMVFAIPYHLVVFLFGKHIGMQASANTQINKPKAYFLIIGAFLMYLFITAIPNAYIFGGFGYQRNYTHCVFVYMLAIGALGYVYGINKSYSNIKRNTLALGIISILLIIFSHIAIDTPKAIKFSKAIDDRTELLLSLKDNGQTGVVAIEKIPDYSTFDFKYLVFKWCHKPDNPKPVLFYFTDADQSLYVESMKKYHKLNFSFMLKE